MKKKMTAIIVMGICISLVAGAANASSIWFVTQGSGGNYQQDIGHLFSWNPSTDVITDRGVLNRGAWGDIAMTPSGGLYGISWKNGVHGGGTYLFEITPGSSSTPATYKALSYTSVGLNALGWAFGRLWAAGHDCDNLYNWVESQGTWQLSAVNGPFDSSGDIELAPDGTLYALGMTKIPSNLYSIDRATGTPIKIGSLDHHFYGLGFDGDILYGFDNDQGGFGLGSDIYMIDPNSHVTIKVRNLNMNVWGATSQPVPIPGTVWLLCSGLAVLTGIKIIRKRCCAVQGTKG